MHKDMRRFKQQLSTAVAEKILESGTNGVISLVDQDGSPYGVHISYAYDGKGHIYFHCALTGHKIDCINADARCSFCVVAQDHIVPEEFTTYYRSVIVSGKIKILTDKDEIHAGLISLSDKYCPGIDPADEIARFIKSVMVLRMDIDRITGKEAKELMRERVQGGVSSDY